MLRLSGNSPANSQPYRSFSFPQQSITYPPTYLFQTLIKGKMEGVSCVHDGMSLSCVLLWTMLLIVLHDVLRIDLAITLR